MRIATPAIAAAGLFLASLAAAQDAARSVEVQKLPYEIAGRQFEGTLALPATAAPAPAVLIVHDWMGPSPFFDSVAEDLAALGYVALAVDVYGVDVRPSSMEEAAKAAGDLRSGDRAELRARMRAALDLVRKHERVDPARVVTVGYCFGGTAALELARSGADLTGTVSMHGSFGGTEKDSARRIKGSILILHGTDDPFAPWEQVSELVKEFDAAGLDFQIVGYGGAHHAFSQPNADMPGRAEYDPKAAARAWDHLTLFLRQVF